MLRRTKGEKCVAVFNGIILITTALICLILGQTATVMVPDLTDMGYMTWDVGHIAKDYDAYKKQTAKTQANMDAFWAPD